MDNSYFIIRLQVNALKIFFVSSKNGDEFQLVLHIT